MVSQSHVALRNKSPISGSIQADNILERSRNKRLKMKTNALLLVTFVSFLCIIDECESYRWPRIRSYPRFPTNSRGRKRATLDNDIRDEDIENEDLEDRHIDERYVDMNEDDDVMHDIDERFVNDIDKRNVNDIDERYVKDIDEPNANDIDERNVNDIDERYVDDPQEDD
ncbi:unnamed protein product [Mytilus coruscus]|uniref:Uncharacterized protein n=1 Tax=Mytilus coruscus TaxID=42192 RepID=A0A6J8BW03_MYTCO|nr:unnamed protein product [Mytilus coruscus]